MQNFIFFKIQNPICKINFCNKEISFFSFLLIFQILSHKHIQFCMSQNNITFLKKYYCTSSFPQLNLQKKFLAFSLYQLINSILYINIGIGIESLSTIKKNVERIGIKGCLL